MRKNRAVSLTFVLVLVFVGAASPRAAALSVVRAVSPDFVREAPSRSRASANGSERDVPDVPDVPSGGGFNITLRHGNGTWLLTERDFSYGGANPFVAGDAARRGASYSEKAFIIRRASGFKLKAADVARYAFPGIDKKLSAAARAVEIKPVDSKVYFYPDAAEKFVITPEADGRELDADKLYSDLLTAFLKSPDVKLNLKTKVKKAGLTAARRKKCTRLKSAFCTSFAGSGEDRRNNIAVAAASFNGRRVEPGEIFSFNKSTGARTAERGYREANIILNGKFEKGLGGGVCQTSTTLYNAALLAGMKITEAHRHSLPVGYVSPSFDAAVSGVSMDLKFKNAGDSPVFIRSAIEGDALRVEFYGAENKYRIERRSETIKELLDFKDERVIDAEGKYRDRAPYRGEAVRITYPKPGLLSKGYLRYYDGGKLVREVCIRSDRYAPQDGLSVEGVLERPPPPPAPDANFPYGGAYGDPRVGGVWGLSGAGSYSY